MKLNYKIIIALSLTFFLTVGTTGVLTYHQLQKTIENQMGNNAMDLAVTISSFPSIQEELAFDRGYEEIQREIEGFREKTRFQYIIVMDMEGIVKSYPYEAGLGKKYLSGGEEEVLTTGKAYVSADNNRFISAIRAFVPIYYNGEQVGAVLVGLLNDTVQREVQPYVQTFIAIVTIALVVGIVVSYLLAHNIKKTIFGLEPKEIALLLGEKDLILQSLQIGLLAVNTKHEIIMLNHLAEEVFGECGNKLTLMDDIDSLYTEQIIYVLESSEPIHDMEIRTKSGVTLLAAFTPLFNHKNEIIGVLSTFQNMTEVKQMAEELIGIKQFTDDLRAQNHEFLNKLHIISGLIQLEEYDEAVAYISELSQGRQQILGLITKRVKDVYVAGLLLAKYNKAAENRIQLVVHSDSHIGNLPEHMPHEKITSIIGNLIENSIEELTGRDNGEIVVKIRDNNNELNILISDNGRGISDSMREKIMEKGITTKKGQRGYGLWIVNKYIKELGGEFSLISENGATWNIIIPYRR